MPPIAQVAQQRTPRRARYLLPRETPRRAEVLAVLTLVLLIAGALFAPVTVVVAAVCHVVSKASRWRAWWLAAPAACGLGWALAACRAHRLRRWPPRGCGAAVRGGDHAVPASRLATVPHVIVPRLPGQCPLALVAGAGVAAIGRWLAGLT